MYRMEKDSLIGVPANILLERASREDVGLLCDALQAFNAPFIGAGDEGSIHIAAHLPNGALAGGILADVALGWMEIHVLWVDPEQRAAGLGASLLRACELEAMELGAHSSRLDTFDWQAETFYRRHGYACFGRLPDYPAGHERIFMSKRLAREVTEARVS